MTEKLVPGTKISNRYLIKHALAEGAMGQVYVAFDCDLLRDVAVKFGAEELDDVGRKRFLREAQSLSKIQHRNIVRCLAVGTHDDFGPYMVLEFVRGETLGHQLSLAGRFDEQRAARVMAQICDACAALHAHDLVHRDLKPSNVMVLEQPTSAEHIKLIDFGLVALASGQSSEEQKLTQAGNAVGTPMYMSPEQCLGQPVDQRADVYAAGCIFFELLTGTYPFSAQQQTVQLMMSHIGIQAPAPSEDSSGTVSRRFDAVIAKALAKDPALRYQTMDAFKGAISEAFDESIGPALHSQRGLSLTDVRQRAPFIIVFLIYVALFFQIQEVVGSITRAMNSTPNLAQTQADAGHAHEAIGILEAEIAGSDFASKSYLQKFAILGNLARLTSLMGMQKQTLHYGGIGLQSLAFGVRENHGRLANGPALYGGALAPTVASLSGLLERRVDGPALTPSEEQQLADWFPQSTMTEASKTILRTAYYVRYSDDARRGLQWLRLLIDEGNASGSAETDKAALDLALQMYVSDDALMSALGVFEQVDTVVSPAMQASGGRELLEVGRLALLTDPRVTSDPSRRRLMEGEVFDQEATAQHSLQLVKNAGSDVSQALVSRISACAIAARNLENRSLCGSASQMLVDCAAMCSDAPDSPYVLSLYIKDFVARNEIESATQLLKKLAERRTSVFVRGNAVRSFLLAMEPRVSPTQYARLRNLYDSDGN